MNEEEKRKEITKAFYKIKEAIDEISIGSSISALFNVLSAFLVGAGMNEETAFHFVNDFCEKYGKTLVALAEQQKAEDELD